MYTPDGDFYVEKIGCRGREGPRTSARGLHGRVYRFKDTIDDDVIRRVIRDSIALVETETGVAAPIPMYVGRLIRT